MIYLTTHSRLFNTVIWRRTSVHFISHFVAIFPSEFCNQSCHLSERIALAFCTFDHILHFAHCKSYFTNSLLSIYKHAALMCSTFGAFPYLKPHAPI